MEKRYAELLAVLVSLKCPHVKVGLLTLTSEHRFVHFWDEVLVELFQLSSCQAGLAHGYKLP